MSIPLPRVLDELRQDLRFAARTTLRTRGFLIAALSLGAAVGATTSVYATADWLLNRPPRGVVEPERLVALSMTEKGRPELDGRYGFSFGQFDAIERVQDAFTDVAAFSKYVEVASGESWQREIVFQFVTGSFFQMHGTRPFLGRLIGPEDDVDGAAALAVLSHSFWLAQFGGDPDVIGKTFRFSKDPVVVIGVLPPQWEDYNLDWIGPTQVWLPMRSAQGLYGMAGMLTHTQTYFPILGRLRPGVEPVQALEMAQRWLEHTPELTTANLFEPNAIAMEPAKDQRISRRAEARTFLGALFAVCLLVLLAACANVANYLLGRAAERRREMALRTAVGASRSRIVRQVVAESALLACVTGAFAAGVGAWLASVLAPLPNLYLGLTTRTDPMSTQGAIDGWLFGLAVGGGFVTCVAVGLVPLVGSFRDPMAALRRAAPGWGWGRLRLSARQGVLVLQVGLGLVLAVAASLLGRSLHSALNVDPEYADPTTLFVARLDPIGLETDDRVVAYEAVRRELDAAPEAVSATMSWNPPFAGGYALAMSLEDPSRRFEVGGGTAGTRYFETMGIDVVAGAEFPDYGVGDEQAIINRRLADALWPGEDAVGKRFGYGSGERRVVAVVARDRCRTLLGPPSGCVWSSYPRSGRGGTLRVRTLGPASEFRPVLEEIVDRVSPDLAINEVQTLEEMIARMTRSERMSAAISTGLAIFGIALLAIGFASVFVAMVRDSRREIAIRMALGATDGRLAARVTGQGLLLLVLGSALGLWLSTLVAARLGDRLIGVSPTDPLSYAFATLVTLTVGLTAAGVAARSATRTEPAVNLRAEG
jgi:predicted permease